MTAIATVILSWEGPYSTMRCARSVMAAYSAAGMRESKIVIVDNGSSDSTVSELCSWHRELDDSQVYLILNSENLGFSVGMNTGIRHCQHIDNFDYYWLLNNDLHVDPESIDALLKAAAAQKQVVIWGPTVISEKTNRTECAGGCIYYRSIGYSRPAHGGKLISEIGELPVPRIDYIYGAAMFVDSNFIARVGGLDESYFLYYEEIELANQLTSSEEMGWCREAIVYHIGAGSSVVAGVSEIKTKQAAISSLRYTRRYCPFFLPTVCLARFLGILLRGLLQLDIRPSIAVLVAFFEFFRDEISIRKSTRADNHSRRNGFD